MNSVLHIWNTFVQSNTFNFVVMVAILYWIVKKFNIAESLENFKEGVANSIHKAEDERKSAKSELSAASKSVENLDSEISEKLKDAEKRAKDIARKIAIDAENNVKRITDNIEKVVAAEEKKISSGLTSKTAESAAFLAKDNIRTILKEHPELHEKYINQSIEEL